MFNVGRIVRCNGGSPVTDLTANTPDQVPSGDPTDCPNCGHLEPQRIAYGYPSPEMWESMERGEIVLGGCVISSESPAWHCRQCEHDWAGPAGPSVAGVAAIWMD